MIIGKACCLPKQAHISCSNSSHGEQVNKGFPLIFKGSLKVQTHKDIIDDGMQYTAKEYTTVKPVYLYISKPLKGDKKMWYLTLMVSINMLTYYLFP